MTKKAKVIWVKNWNFWRIFGVLGSFWSGLGCIWRDLEWFEVFWRGLLKQTGRYICMSYTGFNAFENVVFTMLSFWRYRGKYGGLDTELEAQGTLKTLSQ